MQLTEGLQVNGMIPITLVDVIPEGQEVKYLKALDSFYAQCCKHNSTNSASCLPRAHD